MIKKIFIFGFGYSAQIWAKNLIQQGYSVIATSRSQLIHNQFNHTHPNLTVINFNQDLIQYLQNTDAVLSSIPPNDNGDDAYIYFANEIKKSSSIKWLGYLSSTGVYGDNNGDWVDEKSQPNNNTKRAKRRLIAESQWLSLSACGVSVCVFRLSGIYGAHRNALIKIVGGKNESIYKPNHYFSRIHSLDIARFLTASIESNNNPTSEIFNLSDDTPAPAYEVEAYAAKLLNYPPLKLVEPDLVNLSQMARELYQTNRKISNQNYYHRRIPFLSSSVCL